MALGAVSVFFVGAQSIAADADDARQFVKELNAITGNDAIVAKIKVLVKDKSGIDRRLTKVEALLASEPKAFNFNLARVSAYQKKYDLSLNLSKLCRELALKLKSTTKLTEAFDGEVAVLAAQKKYAEAEKVCQEFLELPGDERDEKLELAKIGFLELMTKLKARQGKIQEALKLADSMVEHYKNPWPALQFKGEILHGAGKNEEAVAVYQEAIEQLEKVEAPAPAKEPMLDRMHYILSSIYVDMDKIDKSAEQLKELLKKHPNNPTYLNDLGYIWADHDQNLDESEKMIRKALDEDRKLRKEVKDLPKEDDLDKAAYLDSMGWVLFKKKQYAEAKKFLLDATKDKDEGQHIEILDHLAEVHMALGEKAEAIAVWKKALAGDANTKRELKKHDEVEKKLKAIEQK